jgi:hypothetical protein
MRRVGSVAWSGGAAAIGPAGQLPTALMRRPMMRPTQQGQIRQVGGATIRPGDQMMALAPGQGPVTVGEHTAAVADGQGAALGRGDDPAGPADIEGLAGDAAEGWGEQVHGGLEPVGQVPVATGVIPQMVAARVAAGVAGDQHPGHRAVAGQPATRLRAERRGPAGLPPDGVLVAQQAVQVHGDSQLGADAAGLGQLPASRARRASSVRASARR